MFKEVLSGELPGVSRVFKPVLSRIGLLSRSEAGLRWLLDFAKGPLDYSGWIRFMHGVVDNTDGYVAVSKTLWSIHISHLTELENKPFEVVYNLITEPLSI